MVRDLLLGRPPHDMDFAFSGGVEAFVQALPHARKVGRSVDVWVARGLEFRPLRGPTLAEDLRTRDLTVNALALDARGRLYAHPLALADMRDGVLRLAADDALSRDPVRVFRVARLAAELPDFTVHPETLERMREMGDSPALAAMPAERVGHEVRRALEADRPARFLRALDEGGCLKPWFAELAQAGHIPAGPAPWHDDSVLEHTGSVMDAVAGDAVAVWMALCHDLGKTLTDPPLWPHHYGHERRGETAADALARRLRLPGRYRKAGMLAARLHMKAGRYRMLRPGTRRDVIWDAHVAGLHTPFWKLVNADSGVELSPEADRDRAVLLAVRLPEAGRGLGEESGRRLRELQCQALAVSPPRSGERQKSTRPSCSLTLPS